MFAISTYYPKFKAKVWDLFPTTEHRDKAFETMKDRASRTGCGGQCDCFRDYGKSFVHCGGEEISIVEELNMKD